MSELTSDHLRDAIKTIKKHCPELYILQIGEKQRSILKTILRLRGEKMLIDLMSERPYKSVPPEWLEREIENGKRTIGLTHAFLEMLEYEQECRSNDELRELKQQQMDDLVKEAKPSEDLIK